jgi:hypothetical protein
MRKFVKCLCAIIFLLSHVGLRSAHNKVLWSRKESILRIWRIYTCFQSLVRKKLFLARHLSVRTGVRPNGYADFVQIRCSGVHPSQVDDRRIRTLQLKKRNVNFLKTDFTEPTDFTAVRYSATNNGLLYNNWFSFQRNVAKAGVKYMQCFYNNLFCDCWGMILQCKWISIN